jgi:alkylation response protein AidB-like acyl-CoA dehydrogenase
MDFRLNDDQAALRDAMIRFARAELGGAVDAHDAEERFDREAWEKCAAFGLFKLPVPREFGGAGADAIAIAAAMEGLGYGCRDNGFVFAAGNHLCSCTMPIVKFGTTAQKQRFLPGLAEGRLVGAHAMSEHGAGSDTSAIEATARRTGDGYVLDGTKAFVTSGPAADLILTFARTSPVPGIRGLSAFLVEKETPGCRVGRCWSKMGLRSAPMSEIVFDGCEIPADWRLGREGDGALVFAAAVEAERCYLSAANLGAMKRQLEASVAHVNRRRQFGRPLSSFQALTHALASIRVEIELAETLLYKVAWLRDERRPAFFETAVLKLFTSESYVRASQTALQVRGASGYLHGTDTERQMRDALAATIYAGTSEIQHEIIASWLGLDGPDDPTPQTPRDDQHARSQAL